MPKFRIWPETAPNYVVQQRTGPDVYLWPHGDFVEVDADTPEQAVEVYESTNPPEA